MISSLIFISEDGNIARVGEKQWRPPRREWGGWQTNKRNKTPGIHLRWCQRLPWKRVCAQPCCAQDPEVPQINSPCHSTIEMCISRGHCNGTSAEPNTKFRAPHEYILFLPSCLWRFSLLLINICSSACCSFFYFVFIYLILALKNPQCTESLHGFGSIFEELWLSAHRK